MSEKLATGVRKRQQILNTNKQMMIYVAVAAAIVTICAVLAIDFWQRIAYQIRVNNEWDATNSSLTTSLANIPTLRSNVEALSAHSNIKSIQGLVDPELEKWQVIFDVLPSSCDPLAVEYAFTNIIFKPSGLGASVKNAHAVLTGGSCDAIGASSTTTGAAGIDGLIKPPAITMTVTFELNNATDDDIQKALRSLEFSLHPVTVQSVDITSDERHVRTAKFVVVTYFVPKADWQVSQKTIPVDTSAPAPAAGGTTNPGGTTP